MNFPEPTRASAGRWRGEICGRFMVGKVPSGGYLTALALRCATGELWAAAEAHDHPPGLQRAPTAHPDVLSCTLHFFRASRVAPFDCTVAIVKSGRATSVLQASMFQEARETMRLMVTCGDLRAAEARGPNFQASFHARPLVDDAHARVKVASANAATAAAPDVPPVSACFRLDAGDNAPPSIRSRVHLLVAAQTATQYENARSTRADGSFDEATLARRSEAVQSRPTAAYEGWCVFPENPGGTPTLAAAPMLLDASVPPVLGAIVSGWVPTLNWRIDFKAHPSAGSGPLRFRFRTRRVTGGFLEEDGELWDGNGNLVALSRQLAMVGVSQARL